MLDQYYVEVFRIADGEVVRRMGPHGKEKAEKIAAGADRNMGLDYASRVVPA